MRNSSHVYIVRRPKNGWTAYPWTFFRCAHIENGPRVVLANMWTHTDGYSVTIKEIASQVGAAEKSISRWINEAGRDTPYLRIESTSKVDYYGNPTWEYHLDLGAECRACVEAGVVAPPDRISEPADKLSGGAGTTGQDFPIDGQSVPITGQDFRISGQDDRHIEKNSSRAGEEKEKSNAPSPTSLASSPSATDGTGFAQPPGPSSPQEDTRLYIPEGGCEQPTCWGSPGQRHGLECKYRNSHYCAGGGCEEIPSPAAYSSGSTCKSCGHVHSYADLLPSRS